MKTKTASVYSNDRKCDITPDEVRRFERFKSYTDEQIGELIDTIKRYTRFIYNVVSQKRKSGKKIALNIDNQHIKSA